MTQAEITKLGAKIEEKHLELEEIRSAYPKGTAPTKDALTLMNVLLEDISFLSEQQSSAETESRARLDKTHSLIDNGSDDPVEFRKMIKDAAVKLPYDKKKEMYYAGLLFLSQHASTNPGVLDTKTRAE